MRRAWIRKKNRNWLLINENEVIFVAAICRLTSNHHTLNCPHFAAASVHFCLSIHKLYCPVWGVAYSGLPHSIEGERRKKLKTENQMKFTIFRNFCNCSACRNRVLLNSIFFSIAYAHHIVCVCVCKNKTKQTDVMYNLKSLIYQFED